MQITTRGSMMINSAGTWVKDENNMWACMTPIAKWHTTLSVLKGYIGEHHFSKLLKGLGKTGVDDQPLSVFTILGIGGWEMTPASLKCFSGVENELWLFMWDCAERCLVYFEDAYPHDSAPRRVLQLSKAKFQGETVDTKELIQMVFYLVLFSF